MSLKTFISNHTNNNNNNNNSNINCVKINYLSSLIATCGNDGKINIFSYKNQNLLQTLQNHSDSIWDLSFSFPFKNYGEFLASCGFDNKLNIYKNNNNYFNVVYSYSHKSSINSCEFCPKEYGIILLCCSSDNSLSLHELNTKNNNNNNNYNFVNKCYFTDYVNGINAISFGPSLIPILFDEDENINDNENNNNINNNNNNLNPIRFVSAGNNGIIKLYSNDNNNNNNNIENFVDENIFKGNSAINKINWLKYEGYSFDTIAFGTEEGFLIILKYKENLWEICDNINVNGIILNICWNHCGSYLSVGTNDNKNHYYQQNLEEKFEEVFLNNNNNIF